MTITGHKFLQEPGERMVAPRKEQNLTQAQLTEPLRISQQLVGFYEKGVRRIPVDRLPKAAHVLGGSIEEGHGLKGQNGNG